MDNQENVTFTGNADELPRPEPLPVAEGFTSGITVEFPKHPDFTGLSGAEVAAKLRERPGFSLDAAAEALARLLEALPVAPSLEQKMAEHQAKVAELSARYQAGFSTEEPQHPAANPHFQWLHSLRRMPIGDLAAELSEEGALRYRGLLHRAYEAIQAFTDPEGRMPAETGEFRDLKVVMLELEAALGVRV